MRFIKFSINISLIFCFVLAAFGCAAIYFREMNQIKNELNKLENVEVINIWGHEDITLEEISARIRIEGKGEIVLYDLSSSSSSLSYPNRVIIFEIGGYSFTWFSWNGGVGPGIDIGIRGELGHLIGKEFNTVKDVIDNYDLILEVIENLEMSPELNHIETETSEYYILIHNEKSQDRDPIFVLLGAENAFEFARTLQWNRKDSVYNRNR
jgi:hypothetical protein